MRVFVTGATGFVGSAIVNELISAGHSVLGLARSDTGAAAVAAAGADVHRGSLQDLDSLRSGAAGADGVIHTAFSHDFSKFAENGQDERHAITALGEALAGSGKRLIVTSGTALLGPGRLVTEDTQALDGAGAVPRAPEKTGFAAVAHGVKVSAVRLSISVHGQGDHGFLKLLINTARQKGSAAFVGDGLNRWPGVHRLDAARLYRLALEKGATEARYHAVADSGVPFRDIATVIGRRLDLPVVSLTPEEAAVHFGWFARFAAVDAPASSLKTQAALDWQPTQPGLLQDLDQPHYFAD